jgi:MFS family permease
MFSSPLLSSSVLPDKKYFWFIAFCQGSTYMSFPAATAMLSSLVSDHEQGAVLAMAAGIRALTQGLAPVVFNGLLSYFTWDRAFAQFPAAPFILSSACILIALALCTRIPEAGKRRKAGGGEEEDKTEEGAMNGYHEVLE